MLSEDQNIDEETKSNYLPFVLMSIVYMLFASFTDLTLFGFLPLQRFIYSQPAITILLMGGVIASSLKIKFNPLIILVLGIEVILIAPSLFLLLSSIFTGHMNIDFFKTFTE